MTRPSNRWKQIERDIMGYLGGKRIPVTGRGRGDVPDGEHAWLVPEIKHRKNIPNWLRQAYLQALAAHTKLMIDDPTTDRLAIVVLHPFRKPSVESYVLLSMSDFRSWFVGEPKERLNDD